MIKEELVTQGKWISPQEFNKARADALALCPCAARPACDLTARPREQVFAVYQALPGPEATELCCYFGQIAKGRLGGLIGGLCFCAPGAHNTTATTRTCYGCIASADLRQRRCAVAPGQLIFPVRNLTACACPLPQAFASCCCSPTCTSSSACSTRPASRPPSTPCGACSRAAMPHRAPLTLRPPPAQALRAGHGCARGIQDLGARADRL